MPAEMGQVLITGGTGFVGSHVVDVALEQGYRVRCTIRAHSRTRWLDGKPVELTQADLNEGDVAAAVRGVDAVIHCAGLTRGSREALFAANHAGTAALLDACLQQSDPPRFILCSSQAAAGPGTLSRPRAEEDPPEPTSDYGRSKLAAEREVGRHAERLETVVLRPGAVYGPRDEDTLTFFRMAARGVVVVPGWRRRLLQVVHVRDVARALVDAIRTSRGVGHAYFIAHPEVLSWGDLTTRIARAVGRRVVPLRVPSPVLTAAAAAAQFAGAGRRAGQIDRRRARDIVERAWTCRVDRAMAELAWSPQYDSERGLHETAAWYRKQGWL